MEVTTQLRLPEYFVEAEVVMSNFDHEIDRYVEAEIKGEDKYSCYTGWNFCGHIWWQENKWHCEVWQFNSYIETVSKDTLDEIMDEVSEKYGEM